jgi:hypothetical protein
VCSECVFNVYACERIWVWLFLWFRNHLHALTRWSLCGWVAGAHTCPGRIHELILFTTDTKGDLLLFATEQGDYAHITSARVDKITEKAGLSPFQAHCTRAGKFGCCRYT